MSKYHVTGTIEGRWECECPDCADGYHTEGTEPIDETVEVGSVEEARYTAEDIFLDNHSWFSDINWVEGPEVTEIE